MTSTPPEPSASARSFADFVARRDGIPSALTEALRVPLPSLAAGTAPRTVVTTGIGASEGPARWLAHELAESGVAARFVPLSFFRLGPVRADLLVAFSQNVSPNARLALGPQHVFASRWLVTSVGYGGAPSTRAALVEEARARGVSVVVVPPSVEAGLLVRLVGPAVAALVSLRLAALLGARSLRDVDLAEAVAAYAAPGPGVSLGAEDVSIVVAGQSVEAAQAHRCKVLETLLRGETPLWDVLQLAHGPLQAAHGRARTVVVLGTPRAHELVERLERTLAPSGPRVVRIVSRRDGPLAFFEHAAGLDACLVETLRAHPRDLGTWPGRGDDAPLYDLGEE